MDWGVCSTIKAPLDQILAFVAWHKHLGAARIWVHLDDPDPASLHVLGEIDGVVPVGCDAAYWGGKRPMKQEVRQGHNIQRVYGQAELPFIAHLDVDEFLWPARPVAEILDEAPEDQPFIRAVPAEALHDPDLADDIFTATQFRLPFPHGWPDARRAEILGEYAPLLTSGMLSHRAGKSLFRTGIVGLVPRLHAASIGHEGKPLPMPLHPDLTVLHFHAQDRAAWMAAAPARAETGAYRFDEPFAEFITAATQQDLADFYDATQVARPKMVEALEAAGLLVRAELKLKEKVAALF